MEGQLRVNPKELETTASDFSGRGKTVASLTQEMLSLVSALSGGWEGDASGAYMKKFAELSGDITQIKDKIQEHATDLQDMARTYASTEDTNTEGHNAMPSDLID